MKERQAAIIAQIRPGKRAELKLLLRQGPPFDLEQQGFTRHEAFLGDTDLVLVFAGPQPVTDAQRLVSTLGASQLAKFGTLVSSPRMLRGVVRMARNVQRPRRLMEPEPHNCTLQDAVGRHERCPGDSCPFWAGQGCALDGRSRRTSRRILNSRATCSICEPRLPV